MSTCIFNDGTVVSDYGRPYIIAEVNSSHNGDVKTAKDIVNTAAKIGCDCVKFQSWSSSSLYSKSYYDANPIAKRFVDKLSLSPEQLKDISAHCRSVGISFSSTPYSYDEVDFLIEECKAPFVKIASMEINNPSFLNYIGSKHTPIILSTGMSSYEEVERAVAVLRNAGAEQIVLLHCVSIYPTILKSVNLNNICALRKRFGIYPIGFSDHTEGDEAAIAAVALGASVLEKHLTLDKSKIGMDNGMATEPDEFAIMIRKCRDIQIALGSYDRIILDEELKQRSKMRRSIVSAKDIPAGTVICSEDLCAKRPGTGIAPDQEDKVIGKKALCDIPADTLITLDKLR